MILIIDNYDSFTYNLYQLVAEEEDVQVFRNDEMTIEQIKSLNPRGIILSPGPGRPEDAGICVEVIKQLSKSIPILGVCLGHQAIGIAFGGKVVQAKQVKHGKRSEISHSGTGLFSSSNQTLEVMRYHSLVIDRRTLPKELMITAESIEDNEIMAVEHRSKPVYGVQFHPESIGTKEGKHVIKAFLTQCRKEKEHEKVFTKA